MQKDLFVRNGYAKDRSGKKGEGFIAKLETIVHTTPDKLKTWLKGKVKGKWGVREGFEDKEEYAVKIDVKLAMVSGSRREGGDYCLFIEVLCLLYPPPCPPVNL